MPEYHEPEIGDVYAFSDGTKFVIYKQLQSVDPLDTTDFFMQFKDCKSPVDIILKLECE